MMLEGGEKNEAPEVNVTGKSFQKSMKTIWWLGMLELESLSRQRWGRGGLRKRTVFTGGSGCHYRSPGSRYSRSSPSLVGSLPGGHACPAAASPATFQTDHFAQGRCFLQCMHTNTSKGIRFTRKLDSTMSDVASRSENYGFKPRPSSWGPPVLTTTPLGCPGLKMYLFLHSFQWTAGGIYSSFHLHRKKKGPHAPYSVSSRYGLKLTVCVYWRQSI